MANPNPLQRQQTGYRLPAGEWFNNIINRVNGFAAGTFTGNWAGLFTPTNGIGPAAGFSIPKAWHTGEMSPPTTTTGTDTTPVVTEVYLARVFIPANVTITGLSLLNGSAVAGNIQGVLYDVNGVPLANTASTAQSGTAAYQQVPFTSPLAVKGPAAYFVAWSFNNTSARFRSHILGNFVAGKATGQVFGTIPNPITIPTGFTTNLGPISDTY